MTSLIKNQVLKHLTKFFKDLAPEQLQLSAFKGSCELSNLQLEEKVLMELLSFPAWIKINRAACDQLAIRIPWTKIKSVPIQMNLNEVTVEVEVCEEFRDISSSEEEMNLANFINTQAPGKYGFVDRVIDGITVTVNNILISFKSKIMSATFNLSRVVLESRCPNWKPGELSLTRIKDVKRGQILLFKIVDWQNMRLEAKCLTDPNQAPLRLITNHAQCRLTIKKNLDDCSVVAARIFVIFEDILWVLTFAQFVSAASFVEYIFTLIKRSPISKKTGLMENQESTPPAQVGSINNPASFPANQTASFISPMNTPVHPNQADKVSILTGNLSSASLLEQKFLCYDLVETSLHLFIDKIDAHLYDDIETTPSSKSNRDSGGALQTTLDQIQVDCYPYSRAISDRKHWYRWFDPSPNSRRQWLKSHFAEFDLVKMKNLRQNLVQEIANQSGCSVDEKSLNFDEFNKQVPTAADEQLLSLTVLIKIKDYCMNCVATKQLTRGAALNKFIQTDKDYHMPSEMPALYLELNYFYYFDIVNRMMVYDNVPDPLMFVHLSPTKLLFDSPTLVFLNSFQVNLSKAFVHLNDLFPEETTAPTIHCRVEILMPQIILPAKSSGDPQQHNAGSNSSLLVKSGKVTLSSSLYDKEIVLKLQESIEKLKQNPSQPINLGCSYQRDNSCNGDWTRVWNNSLVEGLSDSSNTNRLWTIQFEPVWMDFMNYDVDTLASGQRLEPIIEPVNAYAYIHLDLPSTFPDKSSSKSISGDKKHERDVISILFSVVDGSILANMDKIQFGFLQRLGMHVERLIQQIKEDASSIIKLDTVVEDTLEINLTAYIRDIKARLILDKKIDTQSFIVSDITPRKLNKGETQSKLLTEVLTPVQLASPREIIPGSTHQSFGSNYVGNVGKAFESTTKDSQFPEFVAAPYMADESKTSLIGAELDATDLLDECVEVADDASCLFLGDTCSQQEISTSISSRQSNPMSLPNMSDSAATAGSTLGACRATGTSASGGSLRSSGRSPIEESLLINLDEMEQSSQLFAKMNVKQSDQATKSAEKSNISNPAHASPDSGRYEQAHINPVEGSTIQQDIETESISYLELSMSQLMVRRITETKRRQKF